jgi:CTP:molybdopterin cytidylyltransferase MocA
VIAGLVLAAGGGTRFGTRPKLLAELNGVPLLQHAVDAMCDSRVGRVNVVLGAFADALLAGIDLRRAMPIVCPRWNAGLAASLQSGVATLAGAEKIVVTLGDEPLVTAQIIDRMTRQPAGARAIYRGEPGHPVVLGPEHIRKIAALTGDSGAQNLLAGPAVECSDLGTGRDVDTPDDLEAIREQA